jgi:uncharacterized OB-fold protein
VRLRAYPDEGTAIATNAVNGPIWEAAGRGEVAVPRCRDCGWKWMQPLPLCPACQSHNVGLSVQSGRGTLYSFTVLPHPAGDIGYAPAVVELDDAPGVRLISNAIDADSTELFIGMPLEAAFVPLADGKAFTVFRPVRP